MNCSQASVAIGENGDRSIFVYSTPAECKTSRTDRFGTSIAHESKARGIAVVIEHLASNDLKVTLRSLVSGSDVPTLQADNHFFTWFTLRRDRKGIRGLLEPFSHLHRPVAHRAGRR